MIDMPDIIEQHRLLNEATRFVGDDMIVTTITESLLLIDTVTLIQEHRLLGSGLWVGTTALDGRAGATS